MIPGSLRFSVVIANWNYGAFVGAAIDSALALDWTAVEVIVVDDGSTDDSRRIIEAYRERVQAIFQLRLAILVPEEFGVRQSGAQDALIAGNDGFAVVGRDHVCDDRKTVGQSARFQKFKALSGKVLPPQQLLAYESIHCLLENLAHNP